MEQCTAGRIAEILKNAGKGKRREVCDRYGIGEATLREWRRLYQGLEVPEIRRVQTLQEENTRLMRLVAEQSLLIDEFRRNGGR